jgi:hypothetical protein
MLTSADILARVRQQPFVPVRLSTSAGETFDITHPDLVLVGRRDVTIGIADPDEPSIYDRQVRVSILHVTTMTDLPVSPKQQGHSPNGQA